LIKQTAEPPAPKPGGSVNGLTPRETEVLRLIAEGLTSREIAGRLNISFSTVISHRTNLMKKLDIHDTAGLVRFAIRHNILTLQN
jgi:DNA-binding NarL/FixJ family response regulator